VLVSPIEQSVLATLPKRQLSVRLSLKNAGAIFGTMAGVLGALIAIGFFVRVYLPDLLRAPDIWRQGQAVSIISLHGNCSTALDWLPFTHCRYEVTYQSPDGAMQHDEVAALLFGGLDQRTEPVLKIASDDTREVALSWLATAIPERWFALAGICAGFLFLSLVLGLSGWRFLREWRLYRAMGRQVTPEVVTIQSMRLIHAPNYAREYRFSHAGAVGMATAVQLLPVLQGKRGVPPEKWLYEEPIFLDVDRRRAIALRSPDGRRLLLYRSFWPYSLYDAEKTAILNKAALAVKVDAAARESVDGV
jgi:hypothetical protein